jgi:hypothetical protein
MRNSFLAVLCSIISLSGNAQMDTDHYVIDCAYDDGFLKYDNSVYTFLDKSNEPRTPEFKIRACQWPLSIDGETCYLEPKEVFIAEVDGKYGCMNMMGEIQLPFEYDNVVNPEEDRYFAQKNKKWFEIDFKRKKLSEKLLNYDYVADAYLGITVFVRKNELFFSSKGGEITQSYLGDYDLPYFEVSNACKIGIGSINGKLLAKPIYDRVVFSDYSISVYKGDKCALFDREKGEITAMKYDQIEYASGHRLLSYTLNGKEGLMTFDGKELTDPIYTNIHVWGDSLMLCKRDGKRGFVDVHGNESIPCIYEDADGFKNGLAGVKKDGKWGFINEAGEVVIDFQFDNTTMGYYFRKYDRAKATLAGECFYINRKGERLESVDCR